MNAGAGMARATMWLFGVWGLALVGACGVGQGPDCLHTSDCADEQLCDGSGSCLDAPDDYFGVQNMLFDYPYYVWRAENLTATGTLSRGGPVTDGAVVDTFDEGFGEMGLYLQLAADDGPDATASLGLDVIFDSHLVDDQVEGVEPLLWGNLKVAPAGETAVSASMADAHATMSLTPVDGESHATDVVIAFDGGTVLGEPLSGQITVRLVLDPTADPRDEP